jgi:putative ABC transport system permease protein
MRTNLKLAVRVLARRKVFTAISLVGISLTLVVLVVAAAIIDNVFAAHEPQSRLDRMVAVDQVGMYGPEATEISNPGFGFLRSTVTNLPGADRVAITSETESVVVYHGGGRLEAPFRRTNAEYWRVFDHRFIEGAPFVESDVDGNRNVAVITDSLRDQLFGAVPVVGRTIDIGGQPYRIAGVVPRVSIGQIWAFSDIWVPLPPPTGEERTATFGRLTAFVLAKSRADVAPMKREFAARVKRYPLKDPKMFKQIRAGLDTPFEAFARSATHNAMGDRAPLVVGGVAVAVALLFMMLPALNLVTLNLSRILERAPEIGVRKAFGAPRRALIGQFVMENVVLTLLGGIIAFVFALFVLRGIDAVSIIPGAHFELNLRVFAYGMLIAAFFGILSGVYPAWRMSRLDPVNALRGGAA